MSKFNTNKAVPARIREGLNVESGLNDGICAPILFLFIALAVGTDTGGSSVAFAVKLAAQEVGIGVPGAAPVMTIPVGL